VVYLVLPPLALRRQLHVPAPYVQACDEGKGKPEACSELGLQLLRPGKFAERLAHHGDVFRQRHTLA